MRRLNIQIAYIPGPRNKVADGLSRTLFENEECSSTPAVKEACDTLGKQGPQWIWKDGKGGFDAFLASLNDEKKSEVVKRGTLHSIPVFATTSGEDPSWGTAYEESNWFGEMFKFHKYGSPLPPELNRKALNYRLWGDRRSGVSVISYEARLSWWTLLVRSKVAKSKARGRRHNPPGDTQAHTCMHVSRLQAHQSGRFTLR